LQHFLGTWYETLYKHRQSRGLPEDWSKTC
jgi:hypothetical protein